MRPERQGLQMGMFCDYDQPIGFESELAFISDPILSPRLTIHTRWSYGGTRDGADRQKLTFSLIKRTLFRTSETAIVREGFRCWS